MSMTGQSEVVKSLISTTGLEAVLPIPSSLTYSKWDHEDFPGRDCCIMILLFIANHLLFAGPVPRTFVGSFMVSLLALPFSFIPYFAEDKFKIQIVCRIILGFLVIRSFNAFSNAVGKKYGVTTRRALVVLTMIQFHFMFYLSRPLPNTFALCFALWALSRWVLRDFPGFLFLVAQTVVIFRFDSCLLFGWIILYEVFHTKQLSLWRLFKIGIPSGIFALMITISIDSLIWGRLVWPEGEGLYFNVYLNKSNEWGTSHFLWYFYAALPKALFTSSILVPFSTKKCLTNFVILPLMFILTYSILPHKETRFIIYAIPMMNVSAANAIAILVEKYDGNKPASESYLGNMILRYFDVEVVSQEDADAAELEKERKEQEEEEEEKRRLQEKKEPPSQYDAIVPTLTRRRGKYPAVGNNGVEAELDQQYSKITKKLLGKHQSVKREPSPEHPEEEDDTTFVSISFILAFITIGIHLWFNFGLTLYASLAAYNNYPGGNAMANLSQQIRYVDLMKHKNHLQANQIGVHVCNLAAQTGFTRFLELDGVVYDKSPSLQDIAGRSTVKKVPAKADYSLYTPKDFSSMKLIYVVLENVDGAFIQKYCSIPSVKVKKGYSLSKSDVCHFGDIIRKCRIHEVTQGFAGVEFAGAPGKSFVIKTDPILWTFRCVPSAA